MDSEKSEGRDGATGRFTRGNKHGRGNPHAARVAKLRSAILKALTPGAMFTIVGTLIREAQDGDVPAAKLLLDYIGKPVIEAPTARPPRVLEVMVDSREQAMEIDDLIRRLSGQA